MIGGYRDVAALTPPTTPASIEPELLDASQAHRNLHAAETRQLKIRVRRRSADPTTHTPSSSLSEDETTQQGPQVKSWSGGGEENQRRGRPPGPQAVPFSAFIEKHPPPTKAFKAPPSAWSDRTQVMMDEKLKSLVKVTDTSTSSPVAWQQDILREKESPQNNRSTRIVNEGFEVHPAGSLDIQRPVKEFSSLFPGSESIRSPPNSGSNKLRKRSRSRSRDRHSIRRSSFAEDIPPVEKDEGARKSGLGLTWSSMKAALSRVAA